MDTHRVKEHDKARIRCCGQYHTCTAQSDVCVHVHWDTGNTKGVSFFYYCDKCASKEFHGERVRL